MTTETVIQDFRLPPPCKWDLHSSGCYIVQIGI